MRGAFIVSEGAGLYAQVERILVESGARASSDGVVQIDDGQSLFTVFGDIGIGISEVRMGATAVRPGGQTPPDMGTVDACWAECRSAEVFVRWIQVIAGRRANPTWVLDGDGVLWAAAAIDAEALTL